MSRHSERLKFIDRRLQNPKLSIKEGRDILRATIASEIIWLRRNIRKSLVQLNEVCQNHKRLTRLKNNVALQEEPDLQKQIENTQGDLKEMIAGYEEIFIEYGKKAFCYLALYEQMGASTHDLAQLTNCNQKMVEQAYIKRVQERIDDEEANGRPLFTDLIALDLVELAVRQRRDEDFTDLTYKAPLHYAISRYLLTLMTSNPIEEFIKNRKGSGK